MNQEAHSLQTGESPAPSLALQAAAVALPGLLVLQGLSFVYPAAAYPLQGLVVMLGGAFLGACVLLGGDAGGAGWARGSRMVLLAQGAWALLYAVAVLWSPVASYAKQPALTVVSGAMAFLAMLECARRWGQVAPVFAGSRLAGLGRVSAAEIVGGAWVCGAVGLAAHAMYQVWGPASLPGTFAQMREVLAKELAAMGGGDATLEGVLYALRERRATSVFGAPNMLAGFLAPGLILAVAGGCWCVNGRWRVGAWAGAAAIAGGLLLTQSRGAFLATGAGAAWLTARWWWWSGRRPGNVARNGAGAVVAAMVIAMAISTLAPGFSRAQSAAIPEDPHAKIEHRTFKEHMLNKSTGTQRLLYWKTALEIWKESPWVGRGPDAFELGYAEHRQRGAGETVYAHNTVLQYLCEVGLIGVGLFLAWALGGLLVGAGAVGGVAGVGRTSLALEAAAVAMLLHGLVDYCFSYRELYIAFCMLSGVLVGTRSIAGGGAPGSGRGFEWCGRVMQGGALAAVVTVCWMGIPKLLSNHHLQLARDLAGVADGAEEAVERYQAALRWQPDSPEIQAGLGGLLVGLGREAGLTQLQRATALHPKSASIQDQLATAYDQFGRRDAAMRATREAVRLHPLKAQFHLNLAQRLWSDGRKDEARAALGMASELPQRTDGEKARIEKLRALMAAE